MALLEADFAKAIEGFVSAWRISSIELNSIKGEEHNREQGNWDDVQVADKVSRILARL